VTVAERNVTRAAILVEELVRHGCTWFAIGPGARSTPLALAVARHPRAKSTVHTDERGLAFWAIGVARASTRPAVVITTSGTAVANLFPAIVEADVAQVPLIVLSADRPPELRGSGANQTIDQVKIFGSAVRHYAELPLSDVGFSEPALLAAVDRAVAAATASPPGPVHLNVPIREPLGHEHPSAPGDPLLAGWIESPDPWARPLVGAAILSVPQVQGLADLLSATRRGLLVLGALDDETERFAATRLAQHLGWPVVADVTSGLRLGARIPNLLAPIDLLLASRAFRDSLAAEVVLQIGGGVVSKRLPEWIAETAPRHVVVRESPRVPDPCHSMTDHVVAELAELSCELGRRVVPRADEAWVRSLVDAGRSVRALVPRDDLSEPSIARAVSLLGAPVFVGSSMPVRDLDEFGAVEGPVVPVGANRGASGIDGTVASGIGWATALGRPCVIFLGDQALLHDQGSLVLARGTPHLIVVVNNGGGGIFSKLPVAKAGAVFETHFANAHERELGDLARGAGLAYGEPVSLEAFQDAAGAARASGEATMLEIRTDRADTQRLRDRLETDAVAALERRIARPVPLVALPTVGGAEA
jgi:2-succinyl-5-enolpyruvyl-6-hydroxy-3-cyclohexene-1-carboxylate synthase